MPPHFRFLRPLQQCERNIEDLINEIQRDPWPVPTGKRALRSLGVAISLATSLMEVCYPNVAGRIMTFTAGPATQGPGMVVDENQANVIRGWHDIEKDNIQWMTKVNKNKNGLVPNCVRGSLLRGSCQNGPFICPFQIAHSCAGYRLATGN